MSELKTKQQIKSFIIFIIIILIAILLSILNGLWIPLITNDGITGWLIALVTGFIYGVILIKVYRLINWRYF